MSNIIKRNTGKLNILLKLDRKLFHTNDLRLLWGITNSNSLHSTINRYIRRGVFIPLHRGFYSLIPIEDLDPFELGAAAIHNYTYLTTETVLVQNGIIFQNIAYYTYCSAKNQTIKIDSYSIKTRQLADKYLYNPAGIIDKDKYKLASIERAIADMLYFNPYYHFDLKKNIDWNKVKNIQLEVGYL